MITIVDEGTKAMDMIVGGRYVNGHRYVDATEHTWCKGSLKDPKPFGLGTECTATEAEEWLSYVS